MARVSLESWELAKGDEGEENTCPRAEGTYRERVSQEECCVWHVCVEPK